MAADGAAALAADGAAAAAEGVAAAGACAFAGVAGFVAAGVVTAGAAAGALGDVWSHGMSAPPPLGTRTTICGEVARRRAVEGEAAPTRVPTTSVTGAGCGEPAVAAGDDPS